MLFMSAGFIASLLLLLVRSRWPGAIGESVKRQRGLFVWLCWRFRRTRSGKCRTTDLVDTIVTNRAVRTEVHTKQDSRANERDDQS